MVCEFYPKLKNNVVIIKAQVGSSLHEAFLAAGYLDIHMACMVRSLQQKVAMNWADMGDRVNSTSLEEPTCQKGHLGASQKSSAGSGPVLTSPGTWEVESVTPQLKICANTRMVQPAVSEARFFYVAKEEGRWDVGSGRMAERAKPK